MDALVEELSDAASEQGVPPKVASKVPAVHTDFGRGIRALGALALVRALGAFFVGPSRPAVFVRHLCSRCIASGRDVAVSSFRQAEAAEVVTG
ncbi:hypothetical protein [Streptomyces sp. NPDC047014]|uniref:hypothetical protein n=1 Tax=Streptomyces sp. NPDC047014 TaxID=3155736 RepID=UPI0033DBE462